MVSTTSKKQQSQEDKPVKVIWHTCWTGECVGNGEPRPFQVCKDSFFKRITDIVVEVNGHALSEKRPTKHHRAIREALSRFENFISRINAIRDELTGLHAQSLTWVGSSDTLVKKQTTLHDLREQIYAEWEDWRTPLPQPEPMPQVTDKNVCEAQVLPAAPAPTPSPATYAEWEAIPKPCGWKHVDGWWVQSSYGGRYNRLPESVRQMYELSDRQVAILEGQIPVSAGEPKAGLVEGLEWEDWMEGFSGEGFCTPEDLEEKGEASFMIRPEYLQ